MASSFPPSSSPAPPQQQQQQQHLLLGVLSVLPDAVLTFTAQQFLTDEDARAWGQSSSAMLALVKRYNIRSSVSLSKLCSNGEVLLKSLPPVVRLALAQQHISPESLEKAARKVKLGIPTRVMLCESDTKKYSEENLYAQLLSLPSSVKHLHLHSSVVARTRSQKRSGSLVADLVCGKLPARFDSLVFESAGRKEANSLPNWQHWRLPDSLCTLVLPNKWNPGQSIAKVQLPTSLTSLTLPDVTPHIDLSSLQLPPSLRVFRVLDCPHSPDEGYLARFPRLPVALEELHLPSAFSVPISAIPLPKSLRVLRFLPPPHVRNPDGFYQAFSAFKDLRREIWGENLQELWLPTPSHNATDVNLMLDLSALPISLRFLRLPKAISEFIHRTNAENTLPHLDSLRVSTQDEEYCDLKFSGKDDCERELSRITEANRIRIAKRLEDEIKVQEGAQRIEPQPAQPALLLFDFAQPQMPRMFPLTAAAPAGPIRVLPPPIPFAITPASLTTNQLGTSIGMVGAHLMPSSTPVGFAPVSYQQPLASTYALMEQATASADETIVTAIAAVEPHYPQPRSHGVHSPFDIFLFRPASAISEGKTYVLQMIRSVNNGSESWNVWVWWGDAMGYLTYGDFRIPLGMRDPYLAPGRIRQFSTEHEAAQHFCSLFQRKTGVEWSSRNDERAWQARTSGQYCMFERPTRQKVIEDIDRRQFAVSLTAKYPAIPKFLGTSEPDSLQRDPEVFNLLRSASKKRCYLSLLRALDLREQVWTSLNSQCLNNISRILSIVDHLIQFLTHPLTPPLFDETIDVLAEPLPALTPPTIMQHPYGFMHSSPFRLNNLMYLLNLQVPSATLDHSNWISPRPIDFDRFRHHLSVLKDLSVLHSKLVTRSSSNLPDSQDQSDDEKFDSDAEESIIEEQLQQLQQWQQMKPRTGIPDMLDSAIQRVGGRLARLRQVAALQASNRTAEVATCHNPVAYLPAQLSFELRSASATFESILRNAVVNSIEASKINALLQRNAPPLSPPLPVNIRPQLIKHLFAVYPRSEQQVSAVVHPHGPTRLLWFLARFSPARLFGILTTGLREDHGRQVEGFAGKVLVFTPSFADLVTVAPTDVPGEETVALLVEVELGQIQNKPFSLSSPRPVELPETGARPTEQRLRLPPSLFSISVDSSVRMPSVASAASCEGDVMEDPGHSGDVQYSGDSIIESTTTVSACSYRIVQPGEAAKFVPPFSLLAVSSSSYGGFAGAGALSLAISPSQPINAGSSSVDSANTSRTVFPLYLISTESASTRCTIRGLAWLDKD